MLKVIFQMDFVSSLDKKLRQTIPLQGVQYADTLAFRARFDDGQILAHMSLVKKTLQSVSVYPSEKRKAIQDTMWSGIKSDYQEAPRELVYSIGMEEFNKTQIAAITEAVRSPLCLIQGPPGTGKTRVLAGIVAQMFKQDPKKKILVITSMNNAADLLAQELYKIKMIKEAIVRTYSSAKEDIFNVVFEDLKEYSILHKMIFDKDQLADFSKILTEQRDANDDAVHSQEARAKHQIEFYFGKTNYPKDVHLQQHEDKDGWINLGHVNNFKKMRAIGLSQKEVYEVMKHSTVVELKDEGEWGFSIRPKQYQVKLQLLGFQAKSIKQLTKQQFEEFLKHKAMFEQQILASYPIIITTSGNAATRAIRQLDIKRVVIDEATQVKEQESFLATLNAEQIVLVGDQKQLGPTLGFKIEGPTSMFQRLIEAGHPHSFLDTQYRMHSALMRVPNTLFYQNSIKCGYNSNPDKCFLYSKTPFLFIDVKDGTEKLKGTSFMNLKEVDVLCKFTKYVMQQF